MGKADLERAGFVIVSRSEAGGEYVTIWANPVTSCICALVGGPAGTWKASGFTIIRQQWRWLRLIWSRSPSCIERG